MQAFLSDLILRPSCYECPAKCGKSHSDITIADFWGIQNIMPSMDDDKGTSLVILHTEKGEKLMPFKKLRYEFTNNKVLEYNLAFFRPVKENPKRKMFFAAYENTTDINRLFEKMLQPSIKQRAKRIIKYSMQKIMNLSIKFLENRPRQLCAKIKRGGARALFALKIHK